MPSSILFQLSAALYVRTEVLAPVLVYAVVPQVGRDQDALHVGIRISNLTVLLISCSPVLESKTIKITFQFRLIRSMIDVSVPPRRIVCPRYSQRSDFDGSYAWHHCPDVSSYSLCLTCFFDRVAICTILNSDLDYCASTCQHGGACTGPNTCTCSGGYFGSVCQSCKWDNMC